MQAADWPTLAQHEAQLGPILALLAGKTATVRVLDFSGDKIPPFLAAGPIGAGARLRLAGRLGLVGLAGRRPGATAEPGRLACLPGPGWRHC